MNFKLIAFGAAVLSSSYANAATISKSISIGAEITSSNAVFQVQPLSSTGWPSQSLTFSWANSSFNQPSNIAFKAKSSANITAMLTSAPRLINPVANKAIIPLKVTITPTDAVTGNAVVLSLTAQTIYDAAKITGQSWNTYEISMAVDVDNVTDTTGKVLSLPGSKVPGTEEPAAGSYTGSVGLIFESNV